MSPWMDAVFTKSYPGVSIRGELNWADRPRRVTALFGPSGCGKTTVLRCLAGLERLDAGVIRAFGQTWSDPGQRIHVAPQHRGVGFLFQDYMLFPHLNVRDNVAFGAPSQPDQRAQVDQLLQRFQLAGLDRRFPRELSGGQQQRVALARVLAAQPRLLCLDEPLSALDGPTRTHLRIELRKWLREFQLPALIVSHDAIDIQALADDLIVMSDGQVRQSGPVEEVLHQPVDITVARIVGFENFVPVKVEQRDSEGLSVEHVGWRFRGLDQLRSSNTSEGIACIRAEDLRLRKINADEAASLATILECIPEGAMLRVRLKLPSGQILQALVPRSTEFRSGETASIDLVVNAAVIVCKDSR
ncbi:MAG: Fe3+/spermidine/putrescine transporter ATP-binding protein [Planctomycetaceae bacterium]|nr:Fe3+/spermidine/putrescine transporter ATP-binding protein [Planctomycetaceae bacterium]